jgi:hypothetical protein
MAKKIRTICWKRLAVKSIEDAIKKVVELLIVLLAVGVAYKMVLVAIPAFVVGSVIAKLTKVMFLEDFV